MSTDLDQSDVDADATRVREQYEESERLAARYTAVQLDRMITLMVAAGRTPYDDVVRVLSRAYQHAPHLGI